MFRCAMSAETRRYISFQRAGWLTSRCTRPPAAFQVSWRLRRVFWWSRLAVSCVRPAVVRAFQACLACEVVSRVTVARELRR
jgi:hypothetical protein